MSIKSLQGHSTAYASRNSVDNWNEWKNRWVLSRFLKEQSVDAVRMSGGKLFHATGRRLQMVRAMTRSMYAIFLRYRQRTLKWPSKVTQGYQQRRPSTDRFGLSDIRNLKSSLHLFQTDKNSACFQNTSEVTSVQHIIPSSLTVSLTSFCTEPLKPLVLHQLL